MKKVISILTAVVLLLSCTLPAYAIYYNEESQRNQRLIEACLAAYCSDKLFVTVEADQDRTITDIIPEEILARYVEEATWLPEPEEAEEWSVSWGLQFIVSTYFPDRSCVLVFTLNDAGIQNKAEAAKALSKLPGVKGVTEQLGVRFLAGLNESDDLAEINKELSDWLEEQCKDLLCVVITHEYSVTYPVYQPADFDETGVSFVEMISTYADTDISGSKFNKEIFCDILVLHLTEAGVANRDELIKEIEALDFVKGVSNAAVRYFADVPSPNAAQTPSFKVVGSCGLYSGTRLWVDIDYIDLGFVQSASFTLRYDPNVLQPDTEIIYQEMDYGLYYEIPEPGVFCCTVQTIQPGYKKGLRGMQVPFDVIGEGDFGLQMEGGEYTDLYGNKGVADARNRFAVNRTLKEIPTLPENVDPSQLRCGDLNYDQRVSAEDARTILRAAVKLEELTPAQTLCADMDGDGRITAEDARTALRDAVGL